MWGCWHRLAGRVVSRPRASKLVGLVKLWAVRRSTCGRLFVPSVLLLEARLVWWKARISSDHAMVASAMSWNAAGSCHGQMVDIIWGISHKKEDVRDGAHI